MKRQVRNLKIMTRYAKIISVICEYYGINQEDFIQILKNTESRFLLILFLNNYKCMSREDIKESLNIKNTRSLTYSIKKAEEKFLINSEFRKKYFEIEQSLLK